MARADEICNEEGPDPATLRRCYFAGWADEPIFSSVEAATEIIARYVEAGATDFTFSPTTPPSRPRRLRDSAPSGDQGTVRTTRHRRVPEVQGLPGPEHSRLVTPGEAGTRRGK
jgi:hypothetical protein